ncbi:MAG: MbnP family copper-binding protein [Sideroxydans sp.]
MMNKRNLKKLAELGVAMTVIATLVVGCGGKSSTTETPTTPTPTIPTPTTRSISIDFGVLAQNGAASAVLGTDICAKALTLGTNASGVAVAGQVNDMRFFVSGINLVDHNGVAHPVTLDETAFQSTGVALLDFESASAVASGGTIADAAANKCTGGTAATNTVITGTVDNGPHYHGVDFVLGVPVKSTGANPVELNHANGATAGIAPLAAAGMSWNWQGGKKFTKIQYVPNTPMVVYNASGVPATNASGVPVTATTWNVHLGSTGCMFNPAASGVTPAGYECGAPNRVPVALDGTLGGFLDSAGRSTQKVVVDLVELFKTADLTKEAGGAAGCMSGATDPECVAIFSALQLSNGLPASAVTTTPVFKLQ